MENETNKTQTFMGLTPWLGEDSQETDKQGHSKHCLSPTRKIQSSDLKYSDGAIRPVFKERTPVSRHTNEKYKAGS